MMVRRGGLKRSAVSYDPYPTVRNAPVMLGPTAEDHSQQVPGSLSQAEIIGDSAISPIIPRMKKGLRRLISP